jgi:hypothetical protein
MNRFVGGLVLLLFSTAGARATTDWVKEQASPGSFALVADILMAPDDFKVVSIAANDLVAADSPGHPCAPWRVLR